MLELTEIFRSIQSDGSYAGTPAIFIRFSGCNKECDFCTTDHSHHLTLQPFELYSYLVKYLGADVVSNSIIVFTGGEPLLQKEDLFKACEDLRKHNIFNLHLETNGSIDLENFQYFTHVSVSPKTGILGIKIDVCNDLKILYPYIFDKSEIVNFKEKFYWSKLFLQPKETAECDNIENALAEVLSLGKDWKLSVQLQKILKIK